MRKKPGGQGSKRMYELQHKPVQCWFSPQKMALLREVCRPDRVSRVPLATFVRQAAIRAARELQAEKEAEERQAAEGDQEQPELW